MDLDGNFNKYNYGRNATLGINGLSSWSAQENFGKFGQDGTGEGAARGWITMFNSKDFTGYLVNDTGNNYGIESGFGGGGIGASIFHSAGGGGGFSGGGAGDFYNKATGSGDADGRNGGGGGGSFNAGENQVYLGLNPGPGRVVVTLVTEAGKSGRVAFAKHTITTGLKSALGVHTGDLDNDGDKDILGVSTNENKVVWYENDGAENFTANVISNDIKNVRQVHATDLDGDGDNDVVVGLLASSVDAARGLVWFENEGRGEFVEREISTLLKSIKYI